MIRPSFALGKRPLEGVGYVSLLHKMHQPSIEDASKQLAETAGTAIEGVKNCVCVCNGQATGLMSPTHICQGIILFIFASIACIVQLVVSACRAKIELFSGHFLVRFGDCQVRSMSGQAFDMMSDGCRVGSGRVMLLTRCRAGSGRCRVKPFVPDSSVSLLRRRLVALLVV